MIYCFDLFELDTGAMELRHEGRPVPLEPKVFAVLCLLLENRGRVVSKDELVEKVWDGRFISDAAISTAIYSARRALRDDGAAPRRLLTVRGRGYRILGDAAIRVDAPVEVPAQPPLGDEAAAGRASGGRPRLAVLPFRVLGDPGPYPAVAEAVPAELITALSRLRWLTVVARGSSFRIGADAGTEQVRTALQAGYCISGTVEVAGPSLSVFVDLVDTASDRVLWSECYSGSMERALSLRSEIAKSVMSALELHIPVNETAALTGQSSDNLDAWGAYHLGLRHVYRFNRGDNAAAIALFERAVALDPHFARAYAGLSFACFQSAFLRYSAGDEGHAAAARRHAERSMEIDPLDPLGNFNLGRALWLEGVPDAGLPWLARSTVLNPNFAQGFYAHAWADIMAGRSDAGRRNVDIAMTLSPIDPLLYAMQATRAVTHLQQDDADDAASWADRAARAPGSHYLVGAIAVAAQELRGDGVKAAQWAQSVRTRRPDATVRDFFQAFPFEDSAFRLRLAAALAKHGF